MSVRRSAIETALIAVSFGLIAIGCAAPAVNRSRARAAALLVTFVELGGLWRSVRTTAPTLGISRSRSRLGQLTDLLRRPDVAVYRRAIGIRDAELALRPYAPPVERDVIAAQARRLGFDPFSPGLIEAVELDLAGRSSRLGGPPVPTERVLVEGGQDVPGEIRQLKSIARSRRRARRISDHLERKLDLWP